MLFVNCQRDKSLVFVENLENVEDFLRSPGNSILKVSNGQPYLLFSENNDRYNTNLAQVPDSIIAVSRGYLIDHFGLDYFNKYLKFRSSMVLSDYCETDDICSKYLVSYFHQITINDYRTSLVVSTYHNSLGHIVEDVAVTEGGPGNALKMPFNINDRKAVEIAKVNGFAPGYFPWHVVFRVNPTVKRYCWYIKNQTEKLGGHGIEIDAKTGSIRGNYEWWMVDVGGY